VNPLSKIFLTRDNYDSVIYGRALRRGAERPPRRNLRSLKGQFPPPNDVRCDGSFPRKRSPIDPWNASIEAMLVILRIEENDHAGTETQTPAKSGGPPWNKGKLIGAKPPLRPKNVWSVRTKLQIADRKRERTRHIDNVMARTPLFQHEEFKIGPAPHVRH
jgi:hypothetical protein